MANALFLHPYYSDLATLTSATAASGLPVTNLQTQDPAQKHRTTSITTQWIGIDLGSGLAATAACLIGGNLTSAATWTIGASNTDVATARTSPSLAAVSAATAWVGSKTAKPAWANHINFAKWANSTAYRYWAISFSDAGNTDGYLEFGRLMLGAYWQPTAYNVDQNVGIAWSSADAAERMFYGKLAAQRRGYTARQFDLVFSSVDQDEAEDGASELARLRGNGGDFLFSLDPDHATRFPQWSAQCVFASGVRKDGVPLFNNGKQMWAFRSSLLEVI